MDEGATDLLDKVWSAIQNAQQQIRWREGQADRHLQKRIDLEHLDPTATLGEYEAIIHQVLIDPEANIYTFTYNERKYPTVVTDLFGRRWLVMLDMTGTMETAFAVEQPDIYFANPRFTFLGKAKELQA